VVSPTINLQSITKILSLVEYLNELITTFDPIPYNNSRSCLNLVLIRYSKNVIIIE
jgi:hypothetical protein